MAAQLTGLALRDARPGRGARAAQAPTEVNDGFIPAVKQAMEAQYDTRTTTTAMKLIDSVHSYENPDREISLRGDRGRQGLDGHFIGSHVEQGHKTPEGGTSPLSRRSGRPGARSARA
jgi:hypothetical protein